MSLPQPRPSVSLERKLPILIGGLVSVALAATLLLVRLELRRSAVDAAGDRLELVAAELSRTFEGLIGQRTDLYEAVAAEPIVAQFALGESNDVARAQRALDRLRSGSDSDQSIQLRSATGRVIVATGDVPAEEGAAPPRSDRLMYSPLTATESGFSYWVSVPVRYQGTIVGHITQRRQSGGGGQAIGRFEQLLGSDMSLHLTNADGSSEWVSLGGASLHIRQPVERVEATFAFSDTAGQEHFAYAERLEGTPWLLVAQMPLVRVTARMDQVLERIAFVGLLILLLGLLAAWAISRRVTRPLKQLGHVADAIAAGDYSRRTKFDRGDEIGRLARSFDAMAVRVDATHAELQRRYREAQSLAGDLEIANARLHSAIREAEVARAHAQQASSAKSQFVATMSHEIRTPINAIIGYTDLLDLRVAGALTDDQENYVRRIRLSSEHLITVVNDVLDFAKIESGRMRVAADVRSAGVVIRDAVSMLQARAESKNIRLAMTGSTDATFIGDEHRVQQILLNLVSNALKFTPAGGSVTVDCIRRESSGLDDGQERAVWTCISVTDSGTGIAADQIDTIFEPFVQGERGYTRPHGGTGLGLAISRSLARMMGGDVTVESEVGAGSTFTIWLPHPSAAAVAAGA